MPEAEFRIFAIFRVGVKNRICDYEGCTLPKSIPESAIFGKTGDLWEIPYPKKPYPRISDGTGWPGQIAEIAKIAIFG